MFRFNGSPTVLLRSLLLFAILILAPAWAKASDMSFEGGSGCSDPPIFSQAFTFTANSNGGFCSGFGNHSGTNFDSLTFTTSIPNVSPTFLCSPEPFFTTCDFIQDTAANTLTIEFFGLDGPLGTHHGIPVATGCSFQIDCLPPDNFFLNLNNPVCGRLGCAQPFDANGTGDWLTNGAPITFSATANGVPEPGTWALLLGGACVLLARARLRRNAPGR